ncbi:hypothetical protein HPNQ4161_0778 [Helicobacter pylori NQ4161]|nr:hypothetical protein HPNQ4161_0778 [Helicobacter pylori NQ4161]
MSLSLNQKSHALQTPFYFYLSPLFLSRKIIAQILAKNDLKRDNCKVLK